MGWPYSDFSHTAKVNGGPQEYINKIRLHERQITTTSINKKWMCGIAPTLALLIPLAVKGVYDIVEKYKGKKNISDAEAKQAENELIEHFEETDDDKTTSE